MEKKKERKIMVQLMDMKDGIITRVRFKGTDYMCEKHVEQCKKDIEEKYRIMEKAIVEPEERQRR